MVTLAAGIMLGMAPRLCAQYDEDREPPSANERYVYGGLVRMDFKERWSNPATDLLGIRFTRYMPFIGFRQGATDVTFGYTQYPVGGLTRSSVYLGLIAGNDFRIAGNREAAFMFPIVLAADFTKAQSRGTTLDDFNVGSLGIGGGLKLRYHSRDVDCTAQALEIIHYSFEGYAGGSGSSPATVADVAFLLHQVDIADGIVFGYRFRMQTWAMSDTRFNYRSIQHGPYIGVMF